MLRACVAVYILYLAFGLIQEYGTAQNQMITLIAIVVFVIGGGLILFTALRKLVKGEYEDDVASGTNAEPETEIESETEVASESAGESLNDAQSDTTAEENR